MHRLQQQKQKHILQTWQISAIIPHPSPQPTSRLCGPSGSSAICPLPLIPRDLNPLAFATALEPRRRPASTTNVSFRSRVPAPEIQSL
eukprot:scaffold545_cov372-Pavlova_lutheri.AAC.5